jgi:hypothetical protein
MKTSLNRSNFENGTPKTTIQIGDLLSAESSVFNETGYLGQKTNDSLSKSTSVFGGSKKKAIIVAHIDVGKLSLELTEV